MEKSLQAAFVALALLFQTGMAAAQSSGDYIFRHSIYGMGGSIADAPQEEPGFVWHVGSTPIRQCETSECLLSISVSADGGVLVGSTGARIAMVQDMPKDDGSSLRVEILDATDISVTGYGPPSEERMWEVNPPSSDENYTWYVSPTESSPYILSFFVKHTPTGLVAKVTLTVYGRGEEGIEGVVAQVTNVSPYAEDPYPIGWW